MDLLIFSTIFLGLALVYFFIGLWASKNIKTTSDYFLAGRKLGFVSVTATLIATQLGGGMMIGTSQRAYEIGMLGILYTVGIAIGFILLGLGFASKLQSLNISTVSEVFKKHYKSDRVSKFASILSIASLCGLLIGQIVASKTLIHSLGITSEIPFLVFWVLIIGYTVMGGLKAVVATDLAQVALIIVIFTAIFIYNLMQEPSSIKSLVTYTPKANLNDLATLSPVLIMTALYALIEEDLAQRFFASKSRFIASASALSAGLFMILFSCIPIYFGIQAKLLSLNIVNGGSPLIAYLEHTVSPVILAFALCSLVAAITSTADSLLCAMSSNICQDFEIGMLKIENKVTRSQIVTLFVGVASIVLSYFVSKNIIDILVGSYELSVCTLLVPILASFYNKDLPERAAIASIATGLIFFLGFKLYVVPFSGVITIFLSLAAFLIAKKA